MSKMHIPTTEEAARLQEIKLEIETCEAALAAAKSARANIKKFTAEAKTILRGGPPKKRAPRKPKATADTTPSAQ